MAPARVGSDAWAIFGTALGLICLAVFVDSEAVGWLLAPVIILLLIIAMARVPLRNSLLTLMFCALVLENPIDQLAQGNWRSPFFIVGGLLMNHMNTLTGVKPLFMSGMDILLGALLVIGWSRERGKFKTDRAGRVPTPYPLIQMAKLSLVGTVYVLIVGVVRGGDMSIALWQMDRVVYLPIVFYLFHLGLKGPADHLALGKVVLAAATIRAVAATIIIHTVYLPKDDNGIVSILPYATTHNDSILFGTGFVVCLALAFVRAGKRLMRVVYFVLPILVLGMVSNHRRMVWVQVSMVPIALYLVTPTNAIKKKIQRTVLWLSPVAALYCFAGWNSGSSIFKPVSVMRSVIDGKADPSTLWRDIENFDLIDTIKQYSVFGTGYGHAYNEVVQLPAVDYPLERYLPHNSILGLMSYAGYFGFALMTLFWVVGAFFAMRSYYAAKTPIDRAAAIACFGVVLVYLIQCWGDLGLGAPTGVWLLAPALATAGKLAVASGAWQDKPSAPDGPNAPNAPNTNTATA